MSATSIYKPTKPQQKFCCQSCRKQYDDLGGAYVKLKEYVTKEIKKRVRECNPADETRIAAIEIRLAAIEAVLENMRFAMVFGNKA